MKSLVYDAAADMIVVRLTKPQVNKSSDSPSASIRTRNHGEDKTVLKEYSKINSPATQDGNHVSYLSACNKASSSSLEQNGNWLTQGGFGLAQKRALWPEKLEKRDYHLCIRPWMLRPWC